MLRPAGQPSVGLSRPFPRSRFCKSCKLTRYSAALRLTRSLPLSSPFGPTCGWSISTFPKGLDSVNRPPPRSPRLRVSTLSILRFASFASGHVALRAACGRLPSQRPLACVLRCATVASFAPAHVALRAACGRLPRQRPLACVQVSGFQFPVSNFQSPLPPLRAPRASA